MHATGTLSVSGKVKAKKIKAPGPGLKWQLKNRLTKGWLLGYAGEKMAFGLTALTGIPTLTGKLSAVKYGADGSVVNYGVVSRRVITTAFAEYMVDQLQTETSTWGDFKFHDSGVGITGAAVGDTDIETTDGESRATGTQTENGSTVYQSVGTITYTTSKAITEHGLFNAASGVTLMDRHTFAAINVVNTDSIQFTYDFTVSTGG
jgi:hypothetical protein